MLFLYPFDIICYIEYTFSPLVRRPRECILLQTFWRLLRRGMATM